MQTAQDGNDDLRARIRELEQQLEAVSELKDRDEVAAVLVDEDEQAQFEALAEAVEDALRPLPAVVVDAIHADFADLGFDYDWEDPRIAGALRKRLLTTWEESDGTHVSLARNDLGVEKALEALNEIDYWSPSAAFVAAFEAERNLRYDLRDERVWDVLDWR